MRNTVQCDWCGQRAPAGERRVGPGLTYDRRRLVWRPVHLCTDWRACTARATRRRGFVGRLRAALGAGGVR